MLSNNGSGPRAPARSLPFGAKRRWPFVVLALLLMLVVAAAAGALLSSRRLAGSLPVRYPILGLAAMPAGFIVATEGALFTSADGKSWSDQSAFRGKRTLAVSGVGGKGVVWSEGKFVETSNLRTFTPISPGPRRLVALASGPDDALYLSQGPGHLIVQPPAGVARTIKLAHGPREIIALDAAAGPDSPILFAGGLTSGVWRSSHPDVSWRQVLKTPVRAILVDDQDPRTVFLATSGGILVTHDQGESWTFTSLRVPTEAMSALGGKFYALTQDRRLYASTDGAVWQPIS